jgi:Protein kinase domain
MQIGKYTLGALIGQGGAGSVYESTHPVLNRPVAIKILHTNDADARKAFLHEARTVAALSHPNIITIHDVDEHQGQPFMVMERLTTSLADRVAQGPIPPAEVIALLLPVLAALGHAHQQGLIHRDLKPANVLLRQDGVSVLADFGLALPTSQQPTALMGTPEYMAPEQLRNEPLDARADLYALGVLLFELLTGRLPFSGDITTIIRGHLTAQPPPPSSIQPGVAPQLDALVMRMMAKSPANRPQSAAEVAAALRQLPRPTAQVVASTIPAARAAAPAAVPAQQRATLAPRQLAGVAVFVLVVAALVGVALLGAAPKDNEETAIVTTAVVGVSGGDTTRPTTALDPLALQQLAQAPMVGAEPAFNTADYSIAGVTWESDPNAIRFIGDLRNETRRAQTDVRVTVELLNGNGGVIGSVESAADLRVVQPGGTTPFYVLFYEDEVPQSQFEGYRISVASDEDPTHALGYYVYRELRVEVVEVGESSFGSSPVLRGTFYNDRSTAVRFPKLYVAFYDSDNRMVGRVDTFADTPGSDNTLAARSSAPFETILATMTGRGAASYMLYIEATNP